MQKIYLLLLIFYSSILAAQTDTMYNTLDSVTVHAFLQNKNITIVPAAVNVVGKQLMQQFASGSLVNAISATPGVKMEERSPGSYRINIRGSSMRAPFGVRNVKVYYNDIPFTDAGGTTYLNALGYYNYSSLEIIKEPGSSLYGAGTGGVLLINGLDKNEPSNVQLNYTTGSYGLHNIHASATINTNNSVNKISLQHQQSNGYRNHSKLRRDIGSWLGVHKLNKHFSLKTTVLYSDLFYETPGALTLMEYNADPKAARPKAGASISAEEADAAIHQQTILAGVSLNSTITTGLQNNTVVFFNHTTLNNPAIRNYGKNIEPNIGARTTFSYIKNINAAKLTFHAGGELQQNFSIFYAYRNVGGERDTLQTKDEVHIQQAFAFAQATIEIKGWQLSGAMSYNAMHASFTNKFPFNNNKQTANYNNGFAPRVSLLKAISKTVVYATISKGFSPPASGELLPTGSNLNLQLQAEKGYNKSIGLRTSLLKNIFIDVNAYIFTLTNTIVQRRDASGGDYYINSGGTKQKGIEGSINYQTKPKGFIKESYTYVTYTYQHYRYKNFMQLDKNYSGNSLPGNAPNTISAGFMAGFKNNISFNANYLYSDGFYLNDANTDKAKAYRLLGLKAAYTTKFNKTQANIGFGVDNLLNETYSLGHDLNAFGGRYYNTAPGRNYYLQLNMLINYNK